ncbi:hypothetical protein LEP1GSC068_1960 [Leptospira sp. Fiocruz LV3954]|nr:hypothetical protein LEP1GSC068_1960 [Leptospira sp. Fiocruz LV3954]
MSFLLLYRKDQAARTQVKRFELRKPILRNGFLLSSLSHSLNADP